MSKNLKKILYLVLVLSPNSTVKAQITQTHFFVDTIQFSALGVKERLEIFKNIQQILFPIVEKKSVSYSSSFQRNNQLLYKCKTPNSINIFAIRISLLTPLETMKISGASISTRIWQRIKNHYIILSIEAKGRKQKN